MVAFPSSTLYVKIRVLKHGRPPTSQEEVLQKALVSICDRLDKLQSQVEQKELIEAPNGQ